MSKHDKPVQEPVVWMSKADIENPSGWRTVFLHTSAMATENSVPLYTAPPQRKPEPNSDYERGFVDGMSEQARRSVDKAVNAMTKCKPLTEEEIKQIALDTPIGGTNFARAIERAHGIGGQP